MATGIIINTTFVTLILLEDLILPCTEKRISSN